MPLFGFGTRRYEEELMDQPETSREAFEQALADIRWVNRNLGGTKTLINAVESLILKNPKKNYYLLDLGSGSADIPIALIDWAREKGLDLEITALDLHPVAVEDARRQSADYPEISIVEKNALDNQYPDNAFDVVISSMFLHHLSDEDAVRLLKEMDRMSRIGFVINDLERHLLAWLGISTICQLSGRQKVTRNDAPLSVRRAFTPQEARWLVEEAKVPSVKIYREWPFRLVWLQNKHEPA